MSGLHMIYTTCADKEAALDIARTLIDEGLAACGNVIPGLTSVFRWQGKRSEEGEVALILKTSTDRLEAAMARLEELHSYDVPPVEAWPVAKVNQAFRDWVVAETS